MAKKKAQETLFLHRLNRRTDRRTDRRTNGRTDGPTDGPTDGRTDGPTDGRTDKASYRVACPQLKSVYLYLTSWVVFQWSPACPYHLRLTIKPSGSAERKGFVTLLGSRVKKWRPITERNDRLREGGGKQGMDARRRILGWRGES